MQLKTILNRVEHFKSFVYGKIRWVDDLQPPTLEIDVAARKNGRPICSACDQQRPGYDRFSGVLSNFQILIEFDETSVTARSREQNESRLQSSPDGNCRSATIWPVARSHRGAERPVQRV